MGGVVDGWRGRWAAPYDVRGIVEIATSAVMESMLEGSVESRLGPAVTAADGLGMFKS